MNVTEQKKAAREFASKWLKKEGYEKGETQAFWIELLTEVFGEMKVTEKISFEDRVQLGHKSFIDARIPHTKVLIEQKGSKIDLNAEAKQSDGSFLTPYEQAKRYADELPLSEKPRWIVTCNFREFHVHDMEHPQNAATIIDLKNFEKEFQYLTFLVDPKNENIHKEQELSVQAGEIVGKLYDALLEAYGDKDPSTLRSLNVLCVRIVFCLYAEDAGLFPKHLQFFDYLKKYPAEEMRDALLKLFKILDTPDEKRSKHENQRLLDFPYVNGGLFASHDIDIPQFTEEIKEILLQEASSDFDWSEISPTIFGAVFESTLNPETRRKGGMHYTSITNIHKVIDPLFLDELRQEFEEARKLKSLASRNKKLLALQDKMAGLTFLDPACGSGNFLTETFTSLRTLENDIIRIVKQGQSSFEFANPIKISISQFYGIEINDFAVSVAKTALWIAESQMMIKTQDIVQKQLDFLPLKSNANIHEGNALQMDWNDVVPVSQLNFIMGNPPFIGHQNRNLSQVKDMELVFSGSPESYGKIDYVGAWFEKSANFIAGTPIRVAFVATNSLCQGESVAALWRPLLISKHIEIIFCYGTFKWLSEAVDQAAVHCIIVGFQDSLCGTPFSKVIFLPDGTKKIAKSINGYLSDAPTVFINNRSKCTYKGLPKITKGSQATDDGNFFFTEEEFKVFKNKYPLDASKFCRQYLGAQEFINGKKRYCLWLDGIPESQYKHNQEIVKRIKNIEIFRKKSPTLSVQRDASRASVFTQIRQPSCDYLIIPRVTSEKRCYIPVGFVSSNVICGDSNTLVPTESLFIFGMLVSNVHMAWMRTVSGRLKSDYRYSSAVYNEFPWKMDISDKRKQKIEETAKGILDARGGYLDWSLYDLYGASMPTELRNAHKANDRAVMQAYGFKSTMTEPEIVAELFKLYEARVKEVEKEDMKAKQKVKAVKASTGKKVSKSKAS